MKIRIDAIGQEAYGILEHTDYNEWLDMILPLIGSQISVTYVDLMGIGGGAAKVYKHPEVDKRFWYQLTPKSISTPYGYIADELYSGHYHAVALVNTTDGVYRACYRDAGRSSCYTERPMDAPTERSEYPTERKMIRRILVECGIDMIFSEKEEIILWRELFVTGPFRMMNDASIVEIVRAVQLHGMQFIERALKRNAYFNGEYLKVRRQEIEHIKNTCKI